MKDYRKSIFSQNLALARRATLYATRAAMRADLHPQPCALAGANQTLQVIDDAGEFLFAAVGAAGAVGWPELVAVAAAQCFVQAQGDAAAVTLNLDAKGAGDVNVRAGTASFNVNGAGNTVGWSTGGVNRWNCDVAGNLLAGADAAYTIGATGALRPSQLNVGGADLAAVVGARVAATDATVLDVATLTRQTTAVGGGANGIGVGILMRAESTTPGTDADAVQVAAVLTDATVAGATSSFQVRTRTGGGALATTATFAGDGSGTLTGDIQAAGGYRQTLGPWQEVDVAAGKVDAVVPITPTAGAIAGVPVVRAGSVVGIVAILDAALTSTDANPATITVSVHINGGAALAETCVLDAPGGGGAGEALQITLIAKDLRALAAGDIITVSTASSANIAAAARDLTVMVQIEG